MSSWGLINGSVAVLGLGWVVACGGRSVDGQPAPFAGAGGGAHAGRSGGGGYGTGGRSGGAAGAGHAALGGGGAVESHAGDSAGATGGALGQGGSAPSVAGSGAAGGRSVAAAGAPSPGAGGAPAIGGVGGKSNDAGAAAGGMATRECGLLIDDMEDGTGRICHGDGRVGAWYAYNDGFGEQIPAPEAQGTPIPPSVVTGARSSPDSAHAMYSFHTYPDPTILSWQTAWGAGIGLDLVSDGSHYGGFAASAFTGITFWVRSELSVSMLVRVNTLATTPASYGGQCTSDFCGSWSRSVGVTKDWQQVSLSFADLGSYFWPPSVNDPPPTPPPFDLDQLANIQFLFVEYPTDTANRDIWIDDVAFYR